MWGNNDGSAYESGKVRFEDPAIILDAILRCINKTSERILVHNPFAEAEFEENKKNYEAKIVLLGNRSDDNRRKREKVTRKRLQWIENQRPVRYNKSRQYVKAKDKES